MSTCILSFSSRPNGNCAAIAQFLGTLHSNAIVSDVFDSSIAACGNCNYECFHDQHCPHLHDPIYKIYETILQSDLTYFIVPNYCDYPCANFFLFQERGQSFFQKNAKQEHRYLTIPKKFIVISNTNQTNFENLFTAHTTDELPELLFLRAKAYQKSSIAGNLLSSAQAREDIQAFANSAGNINNSIHM